MPIHELSLCDRFHGKAILLRLIDTTIVLLRGLSLVFKELVQNF